MFDFSKQSRLHAFNTVRNLSIPFRPIFQSTSGVSRVLCLLRTLIGKVSGNFYNRKNVRFFHNQEGFPARRGKILRCKSSGPQPTWQGRSEPMQPSHQSFPTAPSGSFFLPVFSGKEAHVQAFLFEGVVLFPVAPVEFHVVVVPRKGV